MSVPFTTQPLTHKQLHTQADAKTQTGIIYRHTSEHTQVTVTYTQVLGQGGTCLVQAQLSMPFLEA